ncbi:uncharacterized protein PG986_011032 [Apiospora aurea]|uniref:Cytochrome P450 n=1 Tax=Apiospora aurea TaxID=335848 RepID=A0ABR1Q3X4_9PEZI
MVYLSALGLLCGLVAHHGVFIRGEWHMRIAHIIVTHAALCIAALYFLYGSHDSWKDALAALTRISASYFSSLCTSIITYRLFFHATSSFPGPKLAGATKLWHVFHTLDSKNFIFLQRLHRKYGPVVRTVLDEGRSQTTKDVWCDVLKPYESAVFTRDVSLHKTWRRSWSQSVSNRRMDIYRPRIAALAERVSLSLLNGCAPVDVGEVMSWFSFDAMGDVLFGEDFGLISSRSLHPGIASRDKALSLLGPLEGAIWIARLGFLLNPILGWAQAWYDMLAFCEEQTRKRTQRGECLSKPDMASFFIQEHRQDSEIRDKQSRDHLLSGTMVSAVVAGSDTTRASLIVLCWFLAKYPIHAERVRSEIRDDENIDTMPHLNGVINEVLRLVPPAMTGNSRITGPRGLEIGGIFNPPFTKVTAPKYPIMRMESAFMFPDEFLPERWYSRPELILDERAFGPFGFGNRLCVGKALARAELGCIAMALLKRFSIRFTPGYDPSTM